jgi:hypothetical protein
MMKLCIKFGKNYFGYSFGYFSQTHPVTLSTTFRSIPEKKHNLVTSPGLPDFSWYNLPKREKSHQMTTKYTGWS